MKQLLAGGVLLAVLTSCGPAASIQPTPPPATTPSSTVTPAATIGPRPTAPVTAGVDAWVDVSVATGWRNPGVVRPVDAPALANPVRLREWLAAMNNRLRADLINRADTQVLLGQRVSVLAITNGWAQVVVIGQRTPLDDRGYPAWIPVGQLTAVAPPSTDSDATVIVPTTWLYDRNATRIVEISFGTHLPVRESDGQRLLLGLPGGRDAYVATSAVGLGIGSPLPTNARAILATARRFVGLPYLWAGTSAFGFDCSGLTYMVYGAHGILLPRDADAQAKGLGPVAR
ncbi:MAG: NlpC/P60 family protein, partial [Candidatus Dormibacteraeota bacterium]|nr:NlpC/P60 family protein [Candidatus Dormibacteraeota bacterium]